MDQFNLLVQQIQNLTMVVWVMQQNNPPAIFLPEDPQTQSQRQTRQSHPRGLELGVQRSSSSFSEHDSTPRRTYSPHTRVYTIRDA